MILLLQINRTASGKLYLCKADSPSKKIVHCHFTNRIFDFFTPKCLIKLAFQQVFGSTDKIGKVTFGWTFDPPLKNYVYSTEFLTSDKQPPCNCSLFPKYCSEFNHFGQHVCTSDLSLLGRQEIKDLMGKGLNHIPLQPLNPHLAYAALLSCLANIANLLDLESLQHSRLSDALFSHFQMCIRSIPPVWLSQETNWLSPQLCSMLNKLKQDWFVVGLDKAPHIPTFICKYLVKVAAEYRLKGPEFLLSEMDPGLVIQHLHSSLNQFTLDTSSSKLPLLFPTFKSHKQKFRWISDASNCVMLHATDVITSCLNLLLSDFKTICDEKFLMVKTFTGLKINNFWLVKNATEVFINLPKYIFSMFSADITQCYENISLFEPSGLFFVLQQISKMVFDWRKRMGHHTISLVKSPRWVKNSLKGPPTHYNCIDLVDLIEWLLSNCFIQIAGHCYRQIHGIPMGFSCSPVMCNLYLAFFEYTWILRELENSAKSVHLTLFQHTYRYMDDILSLNNPIFVDCLKQIYPESLKIEPTFLECLSIGNEKIVTKTTFLNFNISIHSPLTGSFATEFSWKRDNLNLGQIEYVKRKSNRPYKISLKTCLGMVYLIMYSSSDSFNAVQAIGHLIRKYKANGFSSKELEGTIRYFLNKNSWPLSMANKEIVIELLHLLH